MLVRYDSQKPAAARIPLAVDPWLRFQADWEERYAGSRDNGTITWGAPESFQVALSSDATMDIQDFTASRQRGAGARKPKPRLPGGPFCFITVGDGGGALAGWLHAAHPLPATHKPAGNKVKTTHPAGAPWSLYKKATLKRVNWMHQSRVFNVKFICLGNIYRYAEDTID